MQGAALRELEPAKRQRCLNQTSTAPEAAEYKGWVLNFSAQVPADIWDVPGFLKHSQAEWQNI